MSNDLSLYNDIYMFLLSYVQIGVNKHHIWSFIVYGIFGLMVFRKVFGRTDLPVYSAVMTLFALGISNSFYEMFWQYLTWGEPSNMLLALIAFTGTALALIVYNRSEIRWNSKAIWIFGLMVATFMFMYQRGDYIGMRLWYNTHYLSPDPHDWVWMLNKTLGAFVVYPLIKGKNDE